MFHTSEKGYDFQKKKKLNIVRGKVHFLKNRKYYL